MTAETTITVLLCVSLDKLLDFYLVLDAFGNSVIFIRRDEPDVDYGGFQQKLSDRAKAIETIAGGASAACLPRSGCNPRVSWAGSLSLGRSSNHETIR